MALLLLGFWLGAGIFADISVTRNFTTVERFLSNPGANDAASEIAAIGRDRERKILRRNAAEENNNLFRDWERSEFAIGALLIAVVAARRARAADLALAAAMLAIVAIQHFALSPQIASLGRLLPSVPPNHPSVARFWALHGIYSGSEILKLVIGLALAFRLALARSFSIANARAASLAAAVAKPRS